MLFVVAILGTLFIQLTKDNCFSAFLIEYSRNWSTFFVAAIAIIVTILIGYEREHIRTKVGLKKLIDIWVHQVYDIDFVGKEHSDILEDLKKADSQSENAALRADRLGSTILDNVKALATDVLKLKTTIESETDLKEPQKDFEEIVSDIKRHSKAIFDFKVS